MRVTTIDGAPRAWRTLSANLSHQGIFVRMPQPLEPGTRVAISLEANGQALPLAQGEVRWCRYNTSELDGRFQGCGVRFAEYLHPRAEELVGYLVETLDTGKPLKAAPRRRRRWRRTVALGGAIAAIAAALVVLLWPAPPQPLPTPTDSGGALVVLSVAPKLTEELAAMVSPAEEATPLGEAAPALAPAVPPTGEVAGASPETSEPSRGEPLPSERLARAEVRAAAPDAAEPSRLEPLPPERLPPAEVRAAAPAAAELDRPRVNAVADAQPATVAAPPLAAGATLLPAALANGTRRSNRKRASADGQLRLPFGAASAVSWSASPDGLDVRPQLRGDARVARVFSLSDPPRLVFDIEGGAPAKSHVVAASSALITRVRLGKQGARTRVVLDLASEPQRVTRASDHAVLQF
ncbi:MAG: PilZ domain-containing protein [Myxococcus sp.]|nr:PilZ domain-containing protein [Myxococcus sp.]